MVCAAAGADASAAKARIRAQSAARRRAALPPVVRERRPPPLRPILRGGGGSQTRRRWRRSAVPPASTFGAFGACVPPPQASRKINTRGVFAADAASFLKEGATVDALDRTATAQTGLQAAAALDRARDELFREVHGASGGMNPGAAFPPPSHRRFSSSGIAPVENATRATRPWCSGRRQTPRPTSASGTRLPCVDTPRHSPRTERGSAPRQRSPRSLSHWTLLAWPFLQGAACRIRHLPPSSRPRAPVKFLAGQVIYGSRMRRM